MKHILILEDSPERMKFFRQLFMNHKIYHFEHVDDALKACETVKFDLLMLDHDLDGLTYVDPLEYNCGTTFAVMLAGDPKYAALKSSTVIVHSHNDAAGHGMVSTLKAAKFNAVKHTFASIKTGAIKINL